MMYTLQEQKHNGIYYENLKEDSNIIDILDYIIKENLEQKNLFILAQSEDYTKEKKFNLKELIIILLNANKIGPVYACYFGVDLNEY